MTGSIEALAAALREFHRPTGPIQCGARATVNTVHSGGGPGRSARLFCTEPNGHDGDLHRDGICCWSVHEFPDVLVEAREPRDLRRCADCGDAWPCKTIRALLAEGA